jgi:ATP-dependent DNA helicase RecG
MISVSSILNKHKKGTLYFGLKNDGTPYRFTITDSTIRDVSRKIFESIKPQIFPTVTTVEIDGIEVIKVEFSGSDVPYSAFGKYYIRIADEDRELTPSELRKIMINREYEDNWENRISEELLDNVDEQMLERFYHGAVGCGRMPEMAEYTTRALLDKLGLLSGNKLTNAGSVLFSKNNPIKLKLAVFATEHKATFLDISRVEGNIFRLIDAGIGYITRNIRWKALINGENAQRQEIPEIPLDALREAVINSFAHARYDLSVHHEIDIFSNRISIVNPGSFANEFTPIDFANKDLHSYLRNEQIANVLYLCKDVESFGSGLKRIYSSCADAGVSVSYENAEASFTIEFSRKDRNNVPEDDTLNGALNDISMSTISELEDVVLALVRENDRMTSSEIVEKTGKSRRTVNRVTTSLQGKNLIERIGSKKTGYWRAK